MPHLRAHLEWMRLRGLSPTYIANRVFCLGRIARAIAGDPLTATPDEARQWQSARGASISTIYVEVAHWLEYSRWALGEGIIHADPTTRLIVPKLPRRLPRPAPEDALRTAIAGAPRDIRLMLVLAAYDGMRATELAHLDRADVMETLDPPRVLVHGKGSKDRVLPLAPEVITELRLYGLPRFGPVFARRDGLGGHNRPGRISSLVGDYLRESGLTFTLHACRHWFATTALREGRDIRVVQELLGHGSLATTAIYTEVSPADSIDVVRRVGRKLR